MTKQERKEGESQLQREDALAALARINRSLSPEERTRLAQIGINMPSSDLGEALSGQFKFGVRCTYCNKVGLFFVGTEWIGDDGERHDLPPSLPHNRIAWTQDLEPHQIDRNEPNCQSCGSVIPLNSDGSFMRTRGRIVLIEEYQATRDKSFDRKALRAFERENAKGGHGNIGVASSYTLPDIKV